MGEKILAPDFRLLLYTEPDLSSKAKYLIDSVLCEAKVKDFLSHGLYYCLYIYETGPTKILLEVVTLKKNQLSILCLLC